MSLQTKAGSTATLPVRSDVDCRAYDRHATELAASCRLPSHGGDKELQWNGTVQNISKSGMGLVLNRRFEAGTGLRVELPIADDDPAILMARVVRVKAYGGGRWLLGCSFVSPLGDDELDAILSAGRPAEEDHEPVPIASLNENGQSLDRRDPPRASLAKTVHLKGALPGGGLVQILFEDLDLSASQPLERGKVFHLRAGGASPGVLVGRLLVEFWGVREGTWFLEGRFLDEIPGDLMASLGIVPSQI